MSNVAARFVVSPSSPIETKFEVNVQSNDHNLLQNRDLPDQHPISAITGLQEALDNIPDDYITDAELEAALLEKQDVLTAGENIQIENGVISATDTTYTAGTGISIENGVISNTQTSAEWGNIGGTLSDQTDLDNALNDLSGGIDSNHQAISGINQTISTYGNIVTHNTSEFATASQGALADTAVQPADLDDYTTKQYVDAELSGKQDTISDLSTIRSGAALGATAIQPNDNISELNNNVGYITGIISSDVTTALGYTPYNSTNPDGYITNSALVGYATQTWVGQQGYITGITSSDVTTALGYTPYNSSNPSNYQTATQVANSIATETTNRESADNNLQSQIDAIVSSSDVFDIVGTYAELQAYDITTVPVNDIIKVLVDSTHSGAATYYRCVETGGVKSWSYIGSEGAYYTKAEADAAFVPQTRTVNSKALSSNITLTATDVGADVSGAASTAEINAKNYADGLAANYATAAQGALADTALQPNDNITELVNNAGYITGITSTDVTTALGYTPYNSSNPSGYITSSALAPYALSADLATVATTGAYSDLSGTPTIPTVNNPTITFTQGGTTKGTITLNQSSNQTIAFDAGGGGGSYTAGTGISITNDVISVTSPTLTNTATGSNSLVILGNETGFLKSSSVGIGISSSVGMNGVSVGYRANNNGLGVSIGYSSTASAASGAVTLGAYSSVGMVSNYSIAIGYQSVIGNAAAYAIQLGQGTNSEANSFYVSTSASDNWKMLGSDGLIPDARISSNIARASDIPSITEYTANEVETLWESL